MSCDIKIDDIIFQVEKISRLEGRELYPFVGEVDENIKKLLQKIENRESIKNKSKVSELKKAFPQNYSKWIDFALKKRKIKFIYEKIYLDDNIYDIRKKIFVYLSNYNQNDFILPENQELWLESIDSKKEVIGFYYENKNSEKILFKPSVYVTPEQDKNFRVGSNFRINTSENSFLIKDLIDTLNVKNNTIYFTDAKSEEKYILSKNKKLNSGIITYYLLKHFPYLNLNYNLKEVKNNWQLLKSIFIKENIFRKYLDNENNNKLFGTCNIINITIKINIEQANIENQRNKQLDLYQIFDYLREKKIDPNTPFIKYGEDLINIPVSITSKEALNKNKIKKNQLKDWLGLSDITRRMNGIMVKRYLKDYNDEARYISVTLKKNTEVQLYISFENENEADFKDVEFAVKNCKKLIEDINKNIIPKKINNIKSIEPPDLNIKNKSISLKDNTKIKFINIIIPLRQNKKINFKELLEFSKKFPSYLYDETKDLELKNQQKLETNLKLRYKKVSGFTPMNQIIHEIDMLKQKDEKDINIIKLLEKKYQKSYEEASAYLLEWKKKYGATKSSKIDSAYKLGITIEINNNNIKLSGVTKIYIIPIVYNFITKFMLLFFNSNKINKNMTKFLNNSKNNNFYNNLNRYQYNNNVKLDIDDYEEIELLELDDEIEDIHKLYHHHAEDNKNYEIKKNIPGLATNDDLLPEIRLKCDDAIPELDMCADYCNDPSYFLRRLQRYDNNLFKFAMAKNKINKTQYSRACAANAGRQPVILPYDPEKNEIVKRDSFTYSVKYSSSPESYERWYICPNIWCPYCQIPISPDDIDPRTIKKRPTKGEGGVCITAECPFSEKNDIHKVIIRETNMVYPGFLDPAKHPEGLCLPCCFSLPQNNPKSSKYVKFKKCLGDEVNNVNVKKDQIYILGKVSPLERDRYGKLPYDVAKLLKTNLETGYLGDYSGYLKKGIKQYKNNSFLSCIIDILTCNKTNNNININTLLNMLIEKLNEDLFRSLHSGNLEILFNNISTNAKPIENYKSYLKNKEVDIDHKYLWDYLQRENVLFEEGVNIFIFENNSILCPFGEEINYFYDINKKNILILKTDIYYEPIFFLKGDGKSAKIDCIFDTNNAELSKLHEISKSGCADKYDIDWMAVLKDNINKYGLQIENLNYKFEYDLYFIMEEILLSIKSKKLDNDFIPKIQLVDNYNKVFGILLENNLYIPIKPSKLINKIKYKIIYDLNQIEKINYKNVIKLYAELSKKTNIKISITNKILDLKDKKYIIALVNNNNRFIPVTKTADNDKKLTVSKLNYYSDVDEALKNKIIMYDKRIEKINKKNFEDESFNRMRFELSIYIQKNKKYLKEILEIINDNTNNINNKRLKMYKILNEIYKKLISQKAHNIDYNYYKTPNKRIPCGIRDIKKSKKNNYETILSCEEDPHCVIDKKECKLFINKYNLLDMYKGVENYNYFISKILDELLRYKIKREEILNNDIDNVINKELVPENNKKYLLIRSMNANEIESKIEQIYFDNKGVFLDNRNLYEESTTKEYSFNKDYYVKSNANFVNNYKLEDLSTYWLKYLGNKFKIFSEVNDLFTLICNAINSNKNFYYKNESLDKSTLKEQIRKYLIDITKNKKNSNILEENIYNKYKENCSKELRNVNNFYSLISYISDSNYKGCITDLEYISRLYNINILILDKRIKKNQKGFELFNNKSSKYYILLYQSNVLDEFVYNLLIFKNKYLFELEDLPAKFIREILEIS